MLDEDEEAVLHLGVGELGAADDFLEREGSSPQEATAHLLHRSDETDRDGCEKTKRGRRGTN